MGFGGVNLEAGHFAWLLESGLSACALGAGLSALPGVRRAFRLWLGHVLAAFGSAALAAAAVVALVVGRTVAVASVQLVPWFQPMRFRVDGLSAVFLLLIGFVGAAGSLYALGYTAPAAHVGRSADSDATTVPSAALLGSMWNIFIAGMALVVLAGDALSFLFAWEVMSMVSFLLVVAEHRDSEVRHAGYFYAVMTHVGTAFLFGALLIPFALAGTFDFAGMRAVAAALPAGARDAMFVLACVGFGTKAGIVPLHVWLPRAHPAAPSHVSALMSGAMVKTAVYGMIRLALDVLGGGPAWWGWLLIGLGGISAAAGALYATQQSHLKRLLAYSTVENVGLLFMGIGATLLAVAHGQPALAGLALAAVLFHALSHAAFKSLAFMGAGAVLHSTATADMERLGGLIRRMPRTALLTLIGAVALAGLPPLSGFVGEWLSLQAFLRLAGAGWGLATGVGAMLAIAVIALAAGLAAAAALRLFGITFLGRPRSADVESAHDASPAMIAGMAIPCAAAIALGAVPAVALRPILTVVGDLLPGMPALGVTPFGLTVGAGGANPGAVLRSLSVPLTVVSLAALALLGLVLIRRRWPRWRYGTTWTCGIEPEARMQYTGAGFAKPILLMFRGVLLPVRTLRVDRSTHPLFPGEVHYQSEIQATTEQHLYQPLTKGVLALASRFRRFQTGSLQTYLLYLLLALVGALIAAR